jgi:hypothetical protein
MTELLGQVPAKLLFSALLAVVFGAVLTLLLGWHGIRRLAGIPRVPRPRMMYVALSTLWVVLAMTAFAAIGMIFLLRDHRGVDGRTQLAEVRCQAVGPDRLQVELLTSPSAAPERYDVEGDACIVWVNQTEVRPGFAMLGVRAVSRIDRVGQLARPNTNPEWLTPRASQGRRLTDLVVRPTEAVPVTVPVDAQKRLIVVSTPGGPTLEQTST